MCQFQTEIKTVNEDEFVFTFLASKNGLTPKIISYEKSGNQFIIRMEKYSNLLTYSNQYLTTYRQKVREQIRNLHRLIDKKSENK
jgi:hypothetical protein